VWVNVYDGKRGRCWEPRIVHHLEELVGIKGEYNITVHIKADDGGDGYWSLHPKSINKHNQGPILSAKPSDSKYKLSDYLLGRVECLDGLPNLIVKHWKCIHYHGGGGGGINKYYPKEVGGARLLKKHTGDPSP